MDLCSCCKRPPSTTFIQLPTINNTSTLVPSQNEATHHGCHSKETCHTSCSVKRRENIQKWKTANFPSSNRIVCSTIAFKGDTRQSLAECVHVDYKEIEDAGVFKEGKLQALFELMTDIWDIPHPNHVVSVTGGAMKFDIDEEILNDFKDTIRKISRTSGAWVITGGTHAGVMKHVSDALKDESNPICIGIPVFGKIANKDQLKVEQQNEAAVKELLSYGTGSWMKAKGAYLDCCHRYFIMYNDGQEEKYGGEVPFRAALENHIVKNSGKPYVLVVLGGGIGTLQTIYKVICFGHQVVLVKGTGGAADHMAEVIKNGSSEILTEETLSEVVDNHTMMNECRKNSRQFSIAEKDGENNINNILTKSLMPANSSNKENLRLALLWQNTSTLEEIVTTNLRTEGLAEDLESLLVLALAHGNVTFAKTLLFDYEVAIHDILSLDVLKLLYGYQSYEKNFPKKWRGKLREDDYEDIDNLDGSSKVKNDLAEYVYYYHSKYHYQNQKFQDKAFQKANILFSKNGITKIRNQFCDKCPQNIEKSVNDHPLVELFIWSVVCNLPEMATILWPLGQDQIGKALIASHYFQKLAAEYEKLAINDYETISYHRNSETFARLACNLLDECHKKDEDNATKIVRQSLQFADSGKTNLEIAVQYENHDFVAHTSVQKFLTDVWAGELDMRQVADIWGYICVMLVIFFPFFMPLVKFNEKELKDQGNRCVNAQCSISKFTWTCINKIVPFYSAPVVVFLLNLVFQIAFCVYYSYLLIVEGRKMDIEISVGCIILYAMVFGYLTTEVYQISQYDEKNIWKKVKTWFLDFGCHNSWDIFNIVLFVVAFSLNRTFIETCDPRNMTYSNVTSNTTKIGNVTDYEHLCGVPHTIHSINCAFWILRITTALRVYPKFGEYYEMVKLMLADLLGFTIGLVFIILAYGVFCTSILYPKGEAKDMNRPFLSLFMKPWFHIYGEFFIEHARSTESNLSSFVQDKAIRTYEDYLVWIALGIYLIITNIVLLNILIAVFNNTYTNVIAKGAKIWRFNRYQITVEYMNRCTSPPPFCIVEHTIRLLNYMRGGGKPKPTSQKLDLKTSVNISNLSNAETIMLSQFQCDRALHILKHDIGITDGKIEIRESYETRHFQTTLEKTKREQTKDDAIVQTLKEMREEQSNKLDEISLKMSEQNIKLGEQKKKIDEQSETLKKQNKLIEEQKTEIKEHLREIEMLTTKIKDQNINSK